MPELLALKLPSRLSSPRVHRAEMAKTACWTPEINWDRHSGEGRSCGTGTEVAAKNLLRFRPWQLAVVDAIIHQGLEKYAQHVDSQEELDK